MVKIYCLVRLSQTYEARPDENARETAAKKGRGSCAVPRPLHTRSPSVLSVGCYPPRHHRVRADPIFHRIRTILFVRVTHCPDSLVWPSLCRWLRNFPHC